MRLNERQKQKVLEWVADGQKTDEINRRASEFEDPFKVTRDQVRFYRKTRGIDLQELSQVAEFEALNTGLALKIERVKLLKEVAELLKTDVLGENLWIEDVKSVANLPVYVERFNSAEVEQLRGVLEDIAKEVGDRAQKADITAIVNLRWDDGDHS